MRPVVKPLLAVAVALTVVTACSDDNPATSDTDPDGTAAAPSGGTEPATTGTPRESDGVLTIGVLLPQTGEGAAIGIPANAAARSAATLINEAGGVLGEDVVVLDEDEGGTMDTAGAAIDRLLDADVDAIVGPASSLVALEYLGDLMAAGVLTCSPLATAMSLDDYPNRELFFRTIASDSLIADSVAAHAQRTGVTTATVVYLDDAFGRPFARRVLSTLRELDVDVELELPFRADDDMAEVASDLADRASGTIVLVADSASGWALLSELEPLLQDDPPRIVVNDAMRLPPSEEQVAALSEEFRVAIEGISPLGTPAASEPVGAFATNSYDCVNLIALSALVAESDEPAEIADRMRTVANSGAGCTTFTECLDALENGPNIDYNGPRDRLSLGRSGDPSLAFLMLFGFDASGLGVDLGRQTQVD